ncbi:hypothetical protein TIFTF001_054675 [Ficus carica]|uniref:Uncharacterized protein n=1 Tax=Ficus carica TaxID=3494 RepID=A0AA88ECW9_FICCA|nr:hypothetical protein TIFTF001_054675 [Ficus carica]
MRIREGGNQPSALFKLSNIDRRSTSSSRLAASVSAIAIPMNIINQYLSGPLALCYGAITDSSSGVLGPLAISAGSSPSVTMPVKAIFWIEQEKVCASAVVQGRQVRAGSKGKRIGRG